MTKPISPDDLRVEFWGSFDSRSRLHNGERPEKLNISPYVEYYNRQWNIMAADLDGRFITVRTYEDIVDIVRLILKEKSRELIRLYLKKKNPAATESACETSIDLAARLLSMLKIGVVRHQAIPRGKRFHTPQVLDTHHVRLPKSFNAWSINMIGGIQIEFTDYLSDHLLLVDDDTKILIFHHASFLECQQQQSLFPEGLVDETLRTLALLFPQPCTVDPRIALCGNLQAEDRQIERFSFWRDRLIVLKQTYDDATPATLSQWWHDRRNGERWYTFWVAILVLIITTTLGVIQCIESGLQVYKAYFPTPN
ncbi:hypothetical protein M426DRAFT_73035 [Hypoxylon sp. CI-4A]|nr:hypothetical protein M426DRAFT_73035 [Hypoxylon sp. CI-4A]